MPTVQGTDDFNHAIDAAYYGSYFWGSGLAAVSSPLYQSTPKSLEFDWVNNACGLGWAITGSQTYAWMGFPYRQTEANFADLGIARLVTVATTPMLLGLGSTGLYLNIGTNWSTEIAITPNTWYWVEVILYCGATTWQGALKVGETVQTVSATGQTVTTIERVQFYHDVETSSVVAYIGGAWKRGYATSMTDWLGPPLTLDSCLPDADITTTGWSTAPLYSKINDDSDATVIQATAS